jgi:hypothetical protein
LIVAAPGTPIAARNKRMAGQWFGAGAGDELLALMAYISYVTK